jgi:hypothetical protein
MTELTAKTSTAETRMGIQSEVRSIIDTSARRRPANPERIGPAAGARRS